MGKTEEISASTPALTTFLHTYAPGLDFTDIMPPHTKKTALWHITETQSF